MDNRTASKLLLFLVFVSLPLPKPANADFLEEWHRYPVFSEASAFSAISDGSTGLVAVGSNGALATSLDGESWTFRDSGTSANLTDIAYGAGVHVAVANGKLAPDSTPFGTVVTSSDGIVWEARRVDFVPRALAFGGGRFVAVSRTGLYVSEDGESWVKTADGDDEGGPWEDVIYADGMFVAVGAGRLSTSADGNAWNSPPDYVHEEGDHLEVIAFGNGWFFAIGSTVDQGLAVQSTDGVQWVRRTAWNQHQFFGFEYVDRVNRFFAWDEERYYRPTPSSGQGSVLWGAQIKPVPFNGLASSGPEVLAVGDKLSIWRATMPSQTDQLPRADGWVRLMSHNGWRETIRSIGFANGRTLLVGDQGLIVTTLDGNSWSILDPGVTADLNGVVYHAGQWVAVGEDGIVLTSADGVGWSEQNTSIAGHLNAVASGGTSLVAVGDDGAIFASGDGTNWSPGNANVSGDLNGVAFGDGRFVAVGASGAILTSVDAFDWTQVEPKWPGTLMSVTFGDGRFVAVGTEGTVVTSEDGITWSYQDSGYDLRSVSFGDGYFVAAPLEDSPGDGDLLEGVVIVSRDGLEWEVRPTRTICPVSATGYGHGRFLIGAENGMLLYSKVVEVTPEKIDMPSAGGSYDIEVTGAENWTVTGLPTWVSVDPMEGEGDGEISVVLEENSGVQDRVVTVVIGSVPHELRQFGASHSLSVSVLGEGGVSFDPDPEGQRLPAGSVLTLSAEPRDRFLGWSGPGIDGIIDATIEIAVESDLDVTAHFATPTTHLYAIANYNDRSYVGGSSNRILQSGPAGPWQLVEEGLEHRVWAGLAAGADRIVAVENNGGIAVSEDGEKWQNAWGINARLWDVVHEAGYFWAFGDQGRLFRSENGLHWDELATGTSANLRGMAYDGGTFVVVGEGGVVLTSPDGLAWTEQSLDPEWNIGDVTVGPEGFVAVADADTGIVLRSVDGVSWSSSVLERRPLSAIAFGNGRYVVAGGSGGRLATFVSDDAETWEKAEIPLSTTLLRVIHDGERFIASGLFGSVLSSANGLDWKILRSELKSSLWAVDKDSAGNLVAVGEAGRIRERGEEGEWRTSSARSSAWLWDVVSHGKRSIAVGDRGRILRSDDGGPWEVVRNGEVESGDGDDLPIPALRAITHGNGRFVAVGDGEAVISEDGDTWTPAPLPALVTYWSVAYGNGRFVAAGENGAAASSVDGITWETIPFEETASLHAVAYHQDSGFSIGGANGFRAHSPDGVDWQVVAPDDDDGMEDDPFVRMETVWEATESGTGWFVSVGGETRAVLFTPGGVDAPKETVIEVSADGKHWERLDYPKNEWLYDVIAGPWGATAVGHSGTIYEFILPPLVRNQVADLSLSPGDEAFFWAEPGGTPPFEYAWSRDGETLPGADETNYVISSVNRGDIGGYRLEVRNPAGIAQGEPILLAVVTHFEDWLETYQAELPEGERAPGDDPYNTGIPNLLAYSLDHPPGLSRSDLPFASVHRLTVDGVEGDFVTFTFTRSIGTDDLIYHPEVSSDMESWDPLPPANVVSIVREGSRETVTVRDVAMIEELNRSRFFRVRLEKK